MKIIPVTEETFSQAAEVYRTSWRESHKHVCTPEFLEHRDCDGYLRRQMTGLFLLTDGEPAGVVRIHEGTLSDLYIHPRMQGKGYGKALLRFALKQEGNLKLTVLSNNERAIGFYLHHGFRFTGNDRQLRENLWEREMIITEKHNG